MKTLWLVVIVCGAILGNANFCLGFGYERIAGFLETIQSDIQVMKSDVKAFQAKVDQLDQVKLKEEFTGDKVAINSKIDQLMDSDIKAQQVIVINKYTIQYKAIQTKFDKANEEFTDHKEAMNSTMDHIIQSNMPSDHNKIDQLKGDQDKLNEEVIDNRRAMNSTMDLLMDGFETPCPQNGTSGVYELKLPWSLFIHRILSVYCEKGWIVIQRRLDGGSLSFKRNWTEYCDGFGDLQGDYWMGLETMHQITRAGSYELLVVMKHTAGPETRAKFKTFKIASEAEQYQLDLGNFIEGDADGLTHHNGAKFSTPDRDNDPWDNGNCAEIRGSGWWFQSDCSDANLNGERGSGEFWWNGYLAESRMMIRAVK